MFKVWFYDFIYFLDVWSYAFPHPANPKSLLIGCICVMHALAFPVVDYKVWFVYLDPF